MRFLIPLLTLVSCGFAGEMPSGQGSPEGVATDLQKALLFNDSQLYRKVQNPGLLKSKELAESVAWQEKRMSERKLLEAVPRGPIGMIDDKHKEKKLDPERPIGMIADLPDGATSRTPAILKVWRKGDISSAAAIEVARKEYRFKNIGFVDIEVQRSSSRPEPSRLLRESRTFVVQDEDGNWYALDRPDLFPALTQGLRDEKPTKEVIWTAPPAPRPNHPKLQDVKTKSPED